MNRSSDVLFLLAAAIAAITLGLRSVPDVDAQSFGPEVTGGAHAWVDIVTLVPFNNTVTAYTVPNDRVFILTGTMMQEWVEILEDGAVKVPRWTGVGDDGPLALGTARIPFAPGSQVQLLNTSGSLNYNVMLNGYLAHP